MYYTSHIATKKKANCFLREMLKTAPSLRQVKTQKETRSSDCYRSPGRLPEYQENVLFSKEKDAGSDIIGF